MSFLFPILIYSLPLSPPPSSSLIYYVVSPLLSFLLITKDKIKLKPYSILSLSSTCVVTYYLALYPHIQRKLQAELDSALGPLDPLDTEPEVISYSQIKKLPYLDAVINETLRLYPPVSVESISHAHLTLLTYP